jgi:hypothetical protein
MLCSQWRLSAPTNKFGGEATEIMCAMFDKRPSVGLPSQPTGWLGKTASP